VLCVQPEYLWLQPGYKGVAAKPEPRQHCGLAALSLPSRSALWLPTWCMRYDAQLRRKVYGRLSRACGGGQSAYVLTPPLVR
jgi:hypothetical protein